MCSMVGSFPSLYSLSSIRMTKRGERPLTRGTGIASASRKPLFQLITAHNFQTWPIQYRSEDGGSLRILDVRKYAGLCIKDPDLYQMSNGLRSLVLLM